MILPEFLEIKSRLLAKSQSRTVLAIDSSTQLASVALNTHGKTVFFEECFRQKSHSEWINSSVERAMHLIDDDWQSLDLLAVTLGPGSFTGIRVATSLAKTIAYAKDIPLVGYDSLKLLSLQAEFLVETNLVLSVLNAFKNMVFLGLYRRNAQGFMEDLIEPRVVEIEKLLETVGGIISSENSIYVQVVGDGFGAYSNYFQANSPECWIRSSQPKDYPTAKTLVELSVANWNSNKLMHWRELLPTYLRASAAEENTKSGPKKD
jgi:tRNA threonylcarbamoyladenosine biosynthesis protein TsaB